MSSPLITDLDDWVAALIKPGALIELGALLLCGAIAWAIAALGARALDARGPRSILFGHNVWDGVLFPLLWLPLAYAAQTLVAHWVPLAVFKIAIPVLISLLIIRLGAKVLQAAFNDSPLVRLMERTISWVAWVAMVLWVSGLFPLVLEELDQITWKVGGSKMSVRTMIEGGLTAGATLLVALWISAAIETRLLRSATGGELSLRKAASNATRVLLMFVALLLAVSAVGIDLTAFSVLGGAIGVGVGFGLQKLAANYVSGFVILAERSVRIGDNVRVDNFEGIVMEINARYTVIRSLGGRESIVPNELLITTRVENMSLADSRVWVNTVVSVGYKSDAEQVMRLLKQAALNQARVLRDPGPSVNLAAFGADGLEFKVGFWIADPQNGVDGLRSLVNLDILRALRENHIDIPYPQRVIHTVTANTVIKEAGSDVGII